MCQKTSQYYPIFIFETGQMDWLKSLIHFDCVLCKPSVQIKENFINIHCLKSLFDETNVFSFPNFID